MRPESILVSTDLRKRTFVHTFIGMMFLLPVLVCLLGLLIYALSANPKVSELGRLSFAVGLIVALWQLSGHVLRL